MGMERLTEVTDRLVEFKKPNEPTYPKDHLPAMRVPHGGSCCANCEYLTKDRLGCRNKHFIRWHGTHLLPAPCEDFCSDWYEPCESAFC